jgi:hypothetical protein
MTSNSLLIQDCNEHECDTDCDCPSFCDHGLEHCKECDGEDDEDDESQKKIENESEKKIETENITL